MYDRTSTLHMYTCEVGWFLFALVLNFTFHNIKILGPLHEKPTRTQIDQLKCLKKCKLLLKMVYIPGGVTRCVWLKVAHVLKIRNNTLNKSCSLLGAPLRKNTLFNIGCFV